MAPVVQSALLVALVVIMFALGLGLRLADFARVARYPKAFLVGLVAQMILLPIVAFAVAATFALPPMMALGLMILAFCPGGPTSNIFVRMAGGNVALSISFTAVISVLSVVTIPILVALSARHFLGSAVGTVDVTGLGLTVTAVTLLPVCVGIAIHEFRPNWAARLQRPLERIAIGLAFVVVAGALLLNWSIFTQNLPMLAPAVLTLLVSMLFVGVLLGRVLGLSLNDQAAVTIDTGLQNATLGIAVGSLIAEGSTGVADVSVPSGVYGILRYATAFGFVFWRRRAIT